jgi:hypothetical protein
MAEAWRMLEALLDGKPTALMLDEAAAARFLESFADV